MIKKICNQIFKLVKDSKSQIKSAFDNQYNSYEVTKQGRRKGLLWEFIKDFPPKDYGKVAVCFWKNGSRNRQDKAWETEKFLGTVEIYGKLVDFYYRRNVLPPRGNIWSYHSGGEWYAAIIHNEDGTETEIETAVKMHFLREMQKAFGETPEPIKENLGISKEGLRVIGELEKHPGHFTHILYQTELVEEGDMDFEAGVGELKRMVNQLDIQNDVKSWERVFRYLMRNS